MKRNHTHEQGSVASEGRARATQAMNNLNVSVTELRTTGPLNCGQPEQQPSTTFRGGGALHPSLSFSLFSLKNSISRGGADVGARHYDTKKDDVLPTESTLASVGGASCVVRVSP